MVKKIALIAVMVLAAILIAFSAVNVVSKILCVAVLGFGALIIVFGMNDKDRSEDSKDTVKK
jgi:Na+/proline symporter